MRLKKGCHHFTCLFLTIAKQKIKLLLFNFVLFVCRFITYIPFLIASKCWVLYAFIFEKKRISSFWCQNLKKSLNPRWLFCVALNFTSLSIFGLRFASNLYILETFEHLLMFDPKWRYITSLKHHFSKKKSLQILLKF